MSTQLNNRFTVPVPVGRAWDVLLDVERIAPCMPGATLESVEGDTMTGKVRVKVGPITVTYRGEAHFTEINSEERRVELHAGGKEARGTGTASATVTAALHELDEGTTEVTVDTDLTVTGRVAQFGRGVMADVSSKLVSRFAENLAAELQGGSAQEREQVKASAQGGDAAGSAGGGAQSAPHAAGGEAAPANAVVPPQAGEPAGVHPGTAGAADTAEPEWAQPGSRPGGDTRPDDVPGMRARDDTIDLMSTVGVPVLKRVLPVLGLAAVLAVIFNRLRRNRNRRRREG
ncbi:SRPBCC family protein [Streptomonospora sediminis]